MQDGELTMPVMRLGWCCDCDSKDVCGRHWPPPPHPGVSLLLAWGLAQGQAELEGSNIGRQAEQILAYYFLNIYMHY